MIFAIVLVFIFLLLGSSVEAKGIYTPPVTPETNSVHKLPLTESIDLIGSGVR
tara:strand:+ start:390 stop:548 length:159 start_codon:yes stop_codon:yes gene_type:complete